MKNLAIVILNYNAYWETERCIAGIEEHMDGWFRGIVIVDNGSSNESCSYLTSRYQGDSRIKVLACGENLGFARGNNVGIRYARRRWKAEFVLLLNSDVVIFDSRFMEKLSAACEKGVGAVGSNIIGKTGRMERSFLVPASAAFYIRYFCDYHDIVCLKGGGKPKYAAEALHGCVILLTPDYFAKYSGLYPHTFLYHEEVILSIMLEKAGLKLAIPDGAVVCHRSGASTAEALEKNGKRTSHRRRLQSLRHVWIAGKLPYRALARITAGKRGRRARHEG